MATAVATRPWAGVAVAVAGGGRAGLPHMPAAYVRSAGRLSGQALCICRHTVTRVHMVQPQARTKPCPEDKEVAGAPASYYDALVMPRLVITDVTRHQIMMGHCPASSSKHDANCQAIMVPARYRCRDGENTRTHAGLANTLTSRSVSAPLRSLRPCSGRLLVPVGAPRVKQHAYLWYCDGAGPCAGSACSDYSVAGRATTGCWQALVASNLAAGCHSRQSRC